MQVKLQLLKPLDEYSWFGNTQESIVLHTTLGNTYEGAYETLKIRHLSYHYIIEADGTIRNLIPIERSAWHAGVKSNPNLRARVFFNDDNPNKRSIGIAFVRYGNPSLTTEQRDAAVWLIKEIGKETGRRYNRDNIFTHHEITDYKPKEVETYREEVLQALEGYKDDRDAGQKSTTLLYIELLKLKLKYLTLLWSKT